MALAPPDVEFFLYEGLGELPHFNPDLNDENVLLAVADWRAHLRAADGIIFSVPEYAHGVPGVVKNALDWVVGSGEFVGKPVTLFNASPRGTYAQASLTETLIVISSIFVTEGRFTSPHLGKPLSTEEILADANLSAVLRKALHSFLLRISAVVTNELRR